MALETPNVIAAAGTALVSLVSIEDPGEDAIRTYSIELLASSNLSGVTFAPGANPVIDDSSAVPTPTIWQLTNPVDPAQLVLELGYSTGFPNLLVAGPVPTPTGDPLLDDLELGQVLGEADPSAGSNSNPDELGPVLIHWLTAWELPRREAA